MQLTREQQAEAFLAAIGRQKDLPSKVRTRLNRDGVLSRLASSRAFRAYVKAGGDPSDRNAFVTWIIENWSTILMLLLTLFA